MEPKVAKKTHKDSCGQQEVVDLCGSPFLDLEEIEKHDTLADKRENPDIFNLDVSQEHHMHDLEDLTKMESPMIITEFNNKGKVKLIANVPGITGEVKKEILRAKEKASKALSSGAQLFLLIL